MACQAPVRRASTAYLVKRIYHALTTLDCHINELVIVPNVCFAVFEVMFEALPKLNPPCELHRPAGIYTNVKSLRLPNV
jgi:hypothetical protein